MLPAASVVELSRWQFGLTASFHFLFVPLTLGLTWLLVIMETAFLITGKEIYKDMTRFWGKLFGINFAMAVLTGITLEFQFGQNWSYYSQYIGDVFGVPLAVEGMTAFMFESAFFGLFFFGWDRLSKNQHFLSTLCLAIGSNISGLVILVANGWMQHPVGSYFNYQAMRMELNSWNQLWFNSDAQVRFVHTLAAGYTTASIFVLGISAYYLLKGHDIAFAKRSIAVASGFGLASVLSVLVLGDANGLEVDRLQPPKMAAIEAVWTTPKAPASWSLFSIPDQKSQENLYDVKIPWALSLIATHSMTGTVKGLKEIISENKIKIRDGMKAYAALTKMRAGDKSTQTEAIFKKHEKSLGYGLLLKPFTEKVVDATPEQINQAALSSIPKVLPLFWSFRIMVACGLLMLLIFASALFFCIKRTLWNKRWLLRCYLYAIPLPWIAAETGWFIAEHGRQPWTVFELLPTAISSSMLAQRDVITSLVLMVGLFVLLTTVELFLMFKYARLGPSSLHTGRYYFEKLKST
jgi:cytochrome d ubiquinol oxidase subunit I